MRFIRAICGKRLVCGKRTIPGMENASPDLGRTSSPARAGACRNGRNPTPSRNARNHGDRNHQARGRWKERREKSLGPASYRFLRPLPAVFFAAAFSCFGFAFAFGLALASALPWLSASASASIFRKLVTEAPLRARPHARLRSLPRFPLPQSLLSRRLLRRRTSIPLRPRYRVATPSVPPSG